MDPQTPVSQVPNDAPQLPSLPSLPSEPQAPGAQPPTATQPAAPAPPPAPVETAESLLPQIVTAINNGKNVLVTVGSNPSVDELASALGLTVILGKIGKHATAVFSGKIPSAMEFLDPEKTFEDTVDSLRDFIIALDKEKADKLRYKVEDDVVKIFITPYKTVISQKDLQFSQGDFNVDVVIALGALNRDELDKSITTHGRILHDATVISINTGIQKSNLGAINWNDEQSSSVAEMLLSLTDQLAGQLLDTQSATAFLTGIVAETNRFSNEKTSPRVMTLAAQLMAAGANQQLIASNLRQEGMLSESVRSKNQGQSSDDGGEMVLEHDDAKKQTDKKPKIKGQLSAAEKPAKTAAKPVKPTIVASEPAEPATPAPDVSLKLALDTQAKEDPSEPAVTTEAQPAPVTPTPQQMRPEPVVEPVASPSNVVGETELPKITPPSSRDAVTPPQFGGTLNATQLGSDDSATTSLADEPLPTLEHANDGVVGSEDAIEAARKAVEDAAVEPPHKRLESIGSTPLPSVDSAEPPVTPASTEPLPAPTVAPSTAEPTPIDAFMQPHATPSTVFEPPTPVAPMSSVDPAASVQGGLPPLPPLPGAAADGSLPLLPPLPGQAAAPTDPMATFQPQMTPEFIQNMPQTPNSWSQAADNVAAQNQQATADRQAKIDEKVANYEQAVDRNRELQGKAPLNDPNGSGLPPLPPINL